MRRKVHKRSAPKRKMGGVRSGPHDSKRGGSVPRRLEIKFRVRPLVRMPKSVMFGKLLEAVESGVVPDDIEIAYVEYGHGSGRHLAAGARLSADEMGELRTFYNVLASIDPTTVVADHRTSSRSRNPAGVRLESPDA